MAGEDKPILKPALASLVERLKSVQDQADKIGSVDTELDHKTISGWIYEDGPSSQLGAIYPAPQQ